MRPTTRIDTFPRNYVANATRCRVNECDTLEIDANLVASRERSVALEEQKTAYVMVIAEYDPSFTPGVRRCQ